MQMGPSRRDQCVSWIAGEQVLRGKTVRLVKVLWPRSRGGDMGARGHRARQLSLLV